MKRATWGWILLTAAALSTAGCAGGTSGGGDVSTGLFSRAEESRLLPVAPEEPSRVRGEVSVGFTSARGNDLAQIQMATNEAGVAN
jgi:hypothetical protein